MKKKFKSLCVIVIEKKKEMIVLVYFIGWSFDMDFI